MNAGNLIVLTIVYSLTLLAVQRTERRRILLVALLMAGPIAYMTYQWSILRDQRSVVITAAAIAAAVNVLFWLLYGRRHPPGSRGDITVIGMED